MRHHSVRHVRWVFPGLIVLLSLTAGGCAGGGGPTTSPTTTVRATGTGAIVTPTRTPTPRAVDSAPSVAPTASGAAQGVPTPRPPGVVTSLPAAGTTVALTFDGGADNAGTAKIVATLRAEHVPASFFVTGRFAEANPGLLSDLAGLGPVGNHSWDHPSLPKLTDEAVATQLDRTRVAIRGAGLPDPVPFFRFPYGESDARTRAVVAAKGYVAVGWTVDTLGWQGTSGGQSVQRVADRVVSGVSPGGIVLMHLGANPTDHTTLDADALPQIIGRLRAQGYRFVTLESLRQATTTAR